MIDAACAQGSLRGRVFLLNDNIDTDQIIPACFLNWVPTRPDEYEKLGAHALYGLPETYQRYVKPGCTRSDYPIIIAGKNFGCGSSREHAPIALGAAGCQAVIAESFARIFFRNCMATGELFPVEYAPEQALTTAFQTGDEAVLNWKENTLTRLRDGVVFPLRPGGDAYAVIAAGGIFKYARQEGWIKA